SAQLGLDVGCEVVGLARPPVPCLVRTPTGLVMKLPVELPLPFRQAMFTKRRHPREGAERNSRATTVRCRGSGRSQAGFASVGCHHGSSFMRRLSHPPAMARTPQAAQTPPQSE